MIASVLAGAAAFRGLGRNEDPAFVIKTMVVQAAWPGATIDDTVLQVTERLERTLQETPHLDHLRSFTRPGLTTIFVDLQGQTPAKEVPDSWYHVRKSVADMRSTLPAGVVGPGFNDEFGDTYGIIYGFTSDGFPSGSAITVWNVAVNGVMANCRPEDMPILVAIAEILADPQYGVEHSGDTTGGDALIVLSGPIVRDLGFNHENGVMRDGYRANSSVGRFLRLFLRNVVGLQTGAGDKCTFGHAARIVLAEHEAEVAKLGWRTFAEQRGFASDSDVVTIGRFTGDTVVGSAYGRDPEVIARYLADGLVRQSGWELCFTVGLAPDTHRPLVAISPMIAKTLAGAGVDRDGLRQRLFDYARIPAWKMEQYVGEFTNHVPGRPTLLEMHAAGTASAQFALSDDPNRLVPIVERPEDILVVVSGDPYRSNALVFGSNGMHGSPTSRLIRRKETSALDPRELSGG